MLALRFFPHGPGATRIFGPLPFLAVFYGLVAIHYQVEDYLFFAIAPIVCGLLWIGHDVRCRRVPAAAVAALALSAAAIYYHAAQPFSRGLVGTLTGKRVAVADVADIPRASLRIEDRDAAVYRRVLALIEAAVPPGGPILAVPGNAELYFLSGRRNPLPYSFVPFGLIDDDAVKAALATLRRDLPRLVFHVPHLPYNSPHSDAIMEVVRRSYERLESIGEFDIYRLPLEANPIPPGGARAASPRE